MSICDGCELMGDACGSCTGPEREEDGKRYDEVLDQIYEEEE